MAHIEISPNYEKKLSSLTSLSWIVSVEPPAPNGDYRANEGKTMPSAADNSRWQKYMELRPQVIDLEASLAEEWFSPELMSALRYENLREDLTKKRSEIVRQVKAQVVGYLRSGPFNSRRLADIVNYIRLNEAIFKKWHKAVTAHLFAPMIFKNKKNATGYFLIKNLC